MPMDICSHIGFSVTDGLCLKTPEPTQGIVQDSLVDDLGNGVTEFLNIQDDKEDVSGSVLPYKKLNHLNNKATAAPEKSISRWATFPCSSKSFPEGDMKDGAVSITSKVLALGDDVKSLNQHSSRSQSLPTHLKQPVSAMKGSREKRGVTPPVKLTVKWAPDVYDPVPTSASHVVTNNRPSKHSRKNSKNKQKHASKSSRGSKGKDKKQVRRRGGNSSSNMGGGGFKLPEHEEVDDFCEAGPGAMEFHVGNPDQFCGSSFLKCYGASLHLSSVAEAT